MTVSEATKEWIFDVVSSTQGVVWLQKFEYEIISSSRHKIHSVLLYQKIRLNYSDILSLLSEKDDVSPIWIIWIKRELVRVCELGLTHMIQKDIL